MGNNRSLLASGSTATTASLNSTSSLPCNPNLQPQIQIQRISNTPPTQSSVSFLKRFRHPHLSSNNNLDEMDHHNLDQKKKNQKTLHMNKKSKKQTNDANDFKIAKKLEKNKIISLSASNIVSKNSKVSSSNETDYTSINECLPETKLYSEPFIEKLPNATDKTTKSDIVESLYESTLEMDLANSNGKQPHSQTANNKKINDLNKENMEFNDNKIKLSDSNANLYSEIVNKNKSISSHSNQNQQPTNGPPPFNKKNHLQPITNFFNKLTKTTNKNQDHHDKHDLSPAPTVPTKAFNPSIEFYSNLISTSISQTNEEFEEEYDDDAIYSKIDKSASMVNEDEKLTTNLPPLPTTHVPLLTEEIETCLHNYNEYQSIQEYAYIKPELKSSPHELRKPFVYTTIEPLNINNQVYYSFTSDSQEQFDLQNELQKDYISRVDVRGFEKEHAYVEISPHTLNQVSKGTNLNLISEIENSRNQSKASNHVNVKL